MDTTPTTTHRIRRPAALLIAVLTLLGVLGLAEPATAYAPNAPRAIEAVGYDSFTRIYWAPPVDTGGKPITTYTVQRTLKGSNVVQATFTRFSTKPLVDDTVVPGTSYRYRVRATTADGTSNWSQDMPVFTVVGKGELYSFGDEAETFVKRQYQDLLGRTPNPFELATDSQAIELGQKSPGQIIAKLLNDETRYQLRQPVIRLYQAYFHRAPDHGGLDHWVAKRKNGAKLDVVSANFAGSNEFKNTYGKLSNADFVKLVYKNLFDRSPDPEGGAYWTKKLNEGTSRGRVMTQFSESYEFRSLVTGEVQAADVYDDMLDKAIPTSERTLWAAHIQAGGNGGDYGTVLTLRSGY